VAVSFLSGCATTENYKKIVDSWIAAKESALVDAWGPPNGFYEIDGVRYLTYSKVNSGYVPGIAPTTTTNYIGGKPYTNTTGGVQGYYYNNNCSTTFTVKDKVVTNWRFEGNACHAY
jgi:hypothetical protein